MQIEFEIELPSIQRRTQQTSVTRRAAERFPKVARLLVLAYQIEQAIDEGRAKDYVDVSQQLCVTRARITQVMNLLLLAPEIQATILTEPHRVHRLGERQLRPITEEPEWQRQTDMFRGLLDAAKAESILD
jgi:hypothetical protein